MQNPPPSAAAPTASSESLVMRMLNMLAVPGEVFAGVLRQKPKVANWLAPVLLASMVSVASVWVMFSQPALVQQVREAREAALQKQVQAGKLTEKQAEMAAQTAERFLTPQLLKLFGSVGALVGSFSYLLVVASYLWFVGTRVFRTHLTFARSLEICGLSLVTGVVGALVQLLLVLWSGNLQASPGPALLIPDFDIHNKVHLACGALNVFTLWQIALLGLGLSRATGRQWGVAVLWLVTPWALLKAGIIVSGLGSGNMG